MLRTPLCRFIQNMRFKFSVKVKYNKLKLKSFFSCLKGVCMCINLGIADPCQGGCIQIPSKRLCMSLTKHCNDAYQWSDFKINIIYGFKHYEHSHTLHKYFIQVFFLSNIYLNSSIETVLSCIKMTWILLQSKEFNLNLLGIVLKNETFCLEN